MFESGWNTNPVIMGLLVLVGIPVAMALLYFVTGPHGGKKK